MTLLALIALSIGVSLARLLKKKLPRLEHPWLLLLTPTPEILGAFLNLPTALTQSLTYLLVGVAAWANRHLPRDLPRPHRGALLNALAVFLHGGMPVDPDALNRAGLETLPRHLAQGRRLPPRPRLPRRLDPSRGRVLPGDPAIALGLLTPSPTKKKTSGEVTEADGS